MDPALTLWKASRTAHAADQGKVPVIVLIACEFSGVVRRAFARRGHCVVSVDYLPAEDGAKPHVHGKIGFHVQRDIFEYLAVTPYTFDLMIAHPPCTFLSYSGVRWLYKDGKRWLNDKRTLENPRDPDRWVAMEEGAKFYNRLKSVAIPRIAMENSRMHGHAQTLCGRRTQDVQPWMFGVPEKKCISLQLKNLPMLVSTKIETAPKARVHHVGSKVKNRWQVRSRFPAGVADAFATQWGHL